MKRHFSQRSFELSYEIPPRYFMMTYHLKLAEAESGDFIKTPVYEEHRKNLK